ncbi:MAG: DUF805 domain-containing protein [Pseudomonadota bacterium]|uniref:DUF805 domain-containing protein n=1 Tax=Alcanivorax sp. TaxID=1872427 RepID=UPI0025C03D0A|nr:DUF805 domain-containing protein [Alcanivorax sp.]MED5239318.1 DUF805 domain-containing protein [Pseudomonadota bacterium]MEE3321969.1 DUF805 domain-containing protein [Pseudomonadota bacterium]
MNQPYQAPGADVAVAGNETYQPKFISLSGRIGRMRYFVYATGLTMLFYLVVGVVAAILVPAFASGGEGAMGMVAIVLSTVALAAFVGMLIMTWGYMVRRLNDINLSGWMSLLMLVPLANLILGLVLIFKKGSQGGNDYGAAPVANSGGVKAAFAVLLLLLVGYFGVLMPITLQQYAQYVQQAEQSQMQFENFQ